MTRKNIKIERKDVTKGQQNKPLSISTDLAPGLGFDKLSKQEGVLILSTAHRDPRSPRPFVGPYGGSMNIQSREGGPKSTYVPWTSYTVSATYAGMDKYLREYRRDALNRDCINTLGYFVTNKGHETELVPTEYMDPKERETFLKRKEFQDAKAEIDRINKDVNLDWISYIAVVKQLIHGASGFEVVVEDKEGDLLSQEPQWLLPLISEPDILVPKLNEDWVLTGFDYKGEPNFYKPLQVLYFVNNQLESDYRGLSEIEPVLDSTTTRRTILHEALPEAAKVLWAAIGISQVDTSNLKDDEANLALANHKKQIKPGKWIITNHMITSEILDLAPDLKKLIDVVEYCDTDIIGHYKVPRFLIGREKTFNRATAFAELQAFVSGPVAQKQLEMRRQIERQWYDRLLRTILKKTVNERLPVRVKHRWKPYKTEDFMEVVEAAAKLSTSAANLYAQSAGPIDRTQALEIVKKVAELLEMDPSIFEEKKTL